MSRAAGHTHSPSPPSPYPGWPAVCGVCTCFIIFIFSLEPRGLGILVPCPSAKSLPIPHCPLSRQVPQGLPRGCEAAWGVGNSSHLGPAAKDAGNPRRLQSRRPASDRGPVLRPQGQRQPGGAATRAEACGLHLHEAKRPRRLPCAPAGAEGRSGARSGRVGVGRSQVGSGPSRAGLPSAPAWPRTARLWGGACGKRGGQRWTLRVPSPKPGQRPNGPPRND